MQKNFRKLARKCFRQGTSPTITTAHRSVSHKKAAHHLVRTKIAKRSHGSASPLRRSGRVFDDGARVTFRLQTTSIKQLRCLYTHPVLVNVFQLTKAFKRAPFQLSSSANTFVKQLRCTSEIDASFNDLSVHRRRLFISSFSISISENTFLKQLLCLYNPFLHMFSIFSVFQLCNCISTKVFHKFLLVSMSKNTFIKQLRCL